MSEEKKELTQGDIAEVSGGFLFDAHGCGHDHLAYEVIGNKGEILGSFNNKEDAADFAKSKNISTRELNWSQLDSLRKTSEMIENFNKYHRTQQPASRPTRRSFNISKPIVNSVKKFSDYMNEDISGLYPNKDK